MFLEFVLPEAPELLATVGRSVLQIVGSLSLTGKIRNVVEALRTEAKWVDWGMKVTGEVFAASRGAEAWCQGVSHHAGEQIEQIGWDVRAITEHTYNTVIPHSLARLYGYIEREDLVPIRQRLGHDESDIRFLYGWRGQIDNWKNHWVDPNIADWRNFHNWFDTYPINVVNRWHVWFQDPSKFADWATPPLVGPIIAYLAAADHLPSRDKLTQVIVDASPDVYRHVENATLRVLQSRWP